MTLIHVDFEFLALLLSFIDNLILNYGPSGKYYNDSFTHSKNILVCKL